MRIYTACIAGLQGQQDSSSCQHCNESSSAVCQAVCAGALWHHTQYKLPACSLPWLECAVQHAASLFEAVALHCPAQPFPLVLMRVRV
jgi:hypothetical protein